jgi:outer membrane protein OmpA-like peptidoglycan-associated protein
VTLRGVFGGASLTPAGEARLAELGRIAAAHPSFPVALVIHTDKPLSDKEEPAQRARAEAAARALLKGAGNAVRALPLVAGNRAPIADPSGPDRARNTRLEVVFVTPEGF